MKPIRGLTVRQPWATCISHLGKDVENRTWAPPRALVGGYLAIHAGLQVETDAKMWLEEAIKYRTEPAFNLPETFDLGSLDRGCIVAVAQVLGYVHEGPRGREVAGDVDPDWTSPWFTGPYGWVLGRRVVLPHPVEVKGAQGVWLLSDPILQKVREEYSLASDGRYAREWRR